MEIFSKFLMPALCALSISPGSCQDFQGTFGVESSSLLLSVAGHSPAQITLGLRSCDSSRSFARMLFVPGFLVKRSDF